MSTTLRSGGNSRDEAPTTHSREPARSPAQACSSRAEPRIIQASSIDARAASSFGGGQDGATEEEARGLGELAGYDNQAALRLLRMGALRARRAISEPGDPSEREADRIAKALGTPGTCAACASGSPCEKCKWTSSEADVALVPSREASRPGDAATVRAVTGKLGMGQSLAPSQRSFYESKLGTSFDGVRVHTDDRSAATALGIGALAYTVEENVVFAPGRYAPGTGEGDALLAHELVHVAQQRGGNRDAAIHRQVPPQATTQTQATDPKANPKQDKGVTDGGPVAPRSDFYYFRGVMMSTDPDFMRGELKRLIARSGILGGDMWFEALQGVGFDLPLPFSATARAFGGLQPQTAWNAQQDMQENARRNELAPKAVPLAVEIYPEVRQEAIDFLGQFQAGMVTTLETILKESELRLETERTRYGLEKNEGAGVGAFDAKNTVAFAGLVGAAKDLLAIRTKINGLDVQRRQLGSFTRGGSFVVREENRSRYDELSSQVGELEKQYNSERTGAALRYPALGAVLDDANPLGSDAVLTRMASGELSSRPRGRWGPGMGTAGLIGQVIESRQASIDTVRSKAKDNPEQLWKVPPVVQVTRSAMNTASLTMANKVVTEHIERLAIADEITGLLLAITAMVLAIPSGGTSLVGVAAATGTFAISAYQAMQSVAKYQLDLALTNTDLDKRAYAIASEEPSMFWVALDVVFAIADGAAALKAFRAIKSDAKLALAAKDAESAEAADRMAKAADDAAPGKGLGKRLLDKLNELRGRKGPGGLIGAGASEAEAIAKATETVGKEAHTAKTIAYIGGHEVKVTRSGLIIICTECSWLRDRFAREIVETGTSARLAKAEDEVRRVGAAVGDTKNEIEAISAELQKAQKARIAAELGPDAAEKLEKLNREMDVLRDGYKEELAANPALQSDVSRIESIVDPGAKAAEMERVQGLLSDARAALTEGRTLPGGAIDYHAWAARLRAEGVTGDIDAIIRRAQGTGHDAIAARGELRAAERAKLRGQGVEFQTPPGGPGSAQGVKTAEAKITQPGGVEGQLEVKTATEPPAKTTVNKQVDKAYEQIKGSGRRGEIALDWTEVGSTGGDFASQSDVENFIRGKMTNSRLSKIDRMEIVWKDTAGHTMVTSRTRGPDGVVGDVVTRFL